MHLSVQKIGFRRVCGLCHQRISDGSSGDLGTARSERIRAIFSRTGCAYRRWKSSCCCPTQQKCDVSVLFELKEEQRIKYKIAGHPMTSPKEEEISLWSCSGSLGLVGAST